MSIVKKTSEENSSENIQINAESDYSNKIDENEKRNLYFKSQNIIKNAKIEKYMQDREVIANEGLTFLGVITGRNSLQIQRIENIKLKIELLQSQKVEEKEEYEMTDILADLYSCAISELNGKFTNEMKSMYNKIKDNYCDELISDEEIYKLVCEKVDKNQAYLPVIHKEKTRGIFGDIKVQINFLKLENQKLQNQIVIERGKSQFETFKSKIIPLQNAKAIN